MKHKIFCFNNGGSEGWREAMAIGDDGVVVGQHVCSHEGFMLHDLGRHSDDYNKHYGPNNWELEWVETKKRSKHTGLNQAIELNKQRHKVRVK